ncbi:Hsp20/alpha crystallin family protein [Nesterenkonia sp. F]|uniref:Hsp20/alpha crystallin family protein n=1 Tax=Nesterenkonia sp. F TaxID=795955 RepID=UPI000255CB0F|nr:Hsp20/alpha crystallin family protein [Nesterenkonia sp. F]
MATPMTRLDPMSLMDDVFRSLRSPLLGSSALAGAGVGGDRESGFVPAVDARRDGEDLVLRADLPGIDPEKDVNVELSGRTLTVSGERRAEQEAEGLREVRYGSFHRTVTLPQEVSSEAIRADYDAGVLTVTVQGVYAQEAPQRIQVTRGESGQDSAQQIES